jgi:hypothetical protein
MSTGPDLFARATAAIARGAGFLAERQLPDGELTVKTWRPKAPEPVRDPSVFGTALIVCSLSGVRGTEQLRGRACDFIEAHRERHGVWRHWTRGHPEFHFVPPDLDDTSVACLALASVGRPVPANRRLLLANRDAQGLFFSWISFRARWVPSFAYWWISLKHLLLHPISSIAFYYITPSERGDVDAVVNSNVLLYLGRSPDTEPVVNLIVRVLAEQRETSCDKWYEDPFVVWYFFSRVLRATGEDAGAMVLARLNSTAPATALQRALAICVQLDWNERPHDDAIRALLDAQLPSGAWPLAPVYKGRNVRWGSEKLTTGFCLEALSRWLGAADA